MLEKDYIHWQTVFNNDFLPNYSEINTLRNNPNISLLELSNAYAKLFYSACNVLRIFLANRGLFQSDNKNIIKECYYIGLLKYGQDWINIYTLVQKKDRDDVKQMIKIYCEDEQFGIYTELKNKLEGMLNDN